MISTNKTIYIWRTIWILTSLIGGIGLVGLSLNPAYSQDGFPPGRKTFGNAGAISNAPPADFFDDEDDEFKDDFFTDVPPAANRGATRLEEDDSDSRSGGGSEAKNSKKPVDDGIEVGGERGGGVISHNTQKAIKVDSETGNGSKDVITDFNYPDADIMDLAKTLGKLTGKNFIVDKDVKGRVTIISNAPITVSDAWKAFLTALDMNGFTIIPSGSYLRIARQRDARDKQIKTYTGESSPDSDALVTRVFALKYIGADEISRVFRSFSPANARIIAHEQTNTVIVTDTGSNIAKLSKMLDFLDVEGFDAGIEVIPVKYASAVDLSTLIDRLIPGTGAAAGAPKPPGGGGFGGRGSFQARRTKEGGLINTIISDERTNTLIVHANEKGAIQVRELVAKLDKRLPAQVGGGKIHVVYLQFADAEEVSKTLTNFAQSSGSKSPSAPSSNPGGAGIGVNPQETQLFEGQTKISADKSTNSLVITASMTDFTTLQRVINKLDIPRDEVYTEVVIMEIGVQKNFDFNTNVGLVGGNMVAGSLPSGDLLSYFQNPLSSKGAVIPFMTGGSQTLTIGGTSMTVGTVQGLVRALQTNGNVSVLATPQIMTLDNKEATFESTEKIPVPQVSAVSGGVTQKGVSYQDVTLSIKITPQINKLSNFVKLAIETKMSDFSNREVPADVAGLAFATLERKAKTDLVVGDSDTVVLGGLIRDKVSDTVSKIPIIGDIPLLGWLFRSKKSETQKSNLVILITPHIVRQYEKVRALLDKKLKERDDFIETSAGGTDPMRPYRDKIIRSLPDVKNLASYKPKKSMTLPANEIEREERLNEEPEVKPSPVPEEAAKPQAKTEPTKPEPALKTVPKQSSMDLAPKEALSAPPPPFEPELPPVELPPVAAPGPDILDPKKSNADIPPAPPLILEPSEGSVAP